ncbi:phosphatase PAP2 family protein [Tsukamurella pulmonis]|uniref:phosphatase PAP2 family protein n=1 Tax=Tsukamurella pulmonis TaxID=47312 RepID=UPI0009EB7188|nr:phosphatase PAP2 family protein [Tsukamurella pulmonis]RDH11931.1 inositol phosphorylceramide synthase [Tsukamurella pulmonis]
MLVRADVALPRGPRGEHTRGGIRNRPWLWAIGAVVVFVAVIQAAAVAYGLAGPVEGLAKDFVGRPVTGEVKVASLALALMCMPGRLRLPFVGVVLGVEVLFNAERFVVGSPLHFGNGVMWALVALAGYAALRLTGREQVAAYKAAGVAGILIVANAVSAVWLGLTMEALPYVADHFVEVADRALGSPSWVMGRFVHEHGWYLWLITKVYTYLPVGAAVVAYFQLRRSSTEGFPRHHIVRSFIVIGAIGPIVYFLFPVVGPAYAFGNEVAGAGWMNIWPHVLPTSLEPVSAYFSQAAPRNCMPSLHTAWATAILVHALRGPRLLKLFGVFWWVCTISATLGLGAHYGVDLIAGFVFALTLEAAMVRPEDGWHPRRIATVAGGALAFVAILLSIRYLSVPMAQSGALAAVLLLGTAGAMALGYARIARRPAPEDAVVPAPVGERALAA